VEGASVLHLVIQPIHLALQSLCGSYFVITTKGFFAMFLWAFFVAFSRIMVGVHYPGDIMAGALVGLLFGWLVFKLTEEMYFRINLQPLIRN
jgi:undecaprenyl-diphosphatase